MASPQIYSEALPAMRLRVMTSQDVPGGVRLNTLCGWNQTAADWARFLSASPQGCFVMEHQGNIIGTATTISYEERFAWIGMVLVDPEYRMQGIGTALLEKAVEHLEREGIPTAKLDATPQGKPLYEKMGFVSEYEIERCILRRALGCADTPSSLRRAELTGAEEQQIFEMDGRNFGADRGALLRSLAKDAPEFELVMHENDVLQGYAFGRHGRFADHLGPWMAGNRKAAEKLLGMFLEGTCRDTVIVDRLKTNPFATELLAVRGFEVARPLTRMFRGTNEWPGRPESFCAILGPEFG